MKDTDAIMNAILAAAILGTKKDTKTPEIDGDKIRKQAEDIGNAHYHLYEGFKDAGFTDDQAFTLVLKTVGGK